MASCPYVSIDNVKKYHHAPVAQVILLVKSPAAIALKQESIYKAR